MTSRPSDQPINTSRMLSGEAASCAVAMAAAFTVVCLRAHACLYTKPSVTWLQPRWWNSFSLAGIVFLLTRQETEEGATAAVSRAWHSEVVCSQESVLFDRSPALGESRVRGTRETEPCLHSEIRCRCCVLLLGQRRLTFSTKWLTAREPASTAWLAWLVPLLLMVRLSNELVL